MPLAESIGKSKSQQLLTALFAMIQTIMADIKAQIFGVVILADLTDARSNALATLSLQQYILSLQLCQFSYPLRTSGMYLVNEPWFVRTMFNVMRPFMKEIVKENLKCFGRDVKAVHEYVPKETLPAAFGGTWNGKHGDDAVRWVDAVLKRRA